MATALCNSPFRFNLSRAPSFQRKGAFAVHGDVEVKESDFELLIESVKEAGQIMRGEIEPARTFQLNQRT